MKKIDVGLIFFGIVFMALLARVSFVDWSMLFMMPIGILNGYINANAIKKGKFGKLWHNLQAFILLIIFAALFLLKYIQPRELLWIWASYYTIFEISLNLFRGNSWNYVGESATTDKILWKFMTFMVNLRTKKDHPKLIPSKGQMGVLFIATKLFPLVAGYLLYEVPKFDFM